jgi:hypothetical protein
MRDRTRTGFRADVIDFYDSHELNMLAWECQSGLYHVSDATGIEEVVERARRRPSRGGRIGGHGTAFLGHPFHPLSPGRSGHPRAGWMLVRCTELDFVRHPRTLLDRFELPDGRSIHPYALVSTIMAGGPWVRRYQIV